MKRLVLELDEEVHSMIKIKAAQEEKSMREILTDLVMRWLKRE